MQLDIQGRHSDEDSIGQALSWHDGLLLALVVHLFLIAALIFAPRVLPAPVVPVQVVARQEPPIQFVFVQPKLDLEAKRPRAQAPPSDKSRVAQSPEQKQPSLVLQPKVTGNSQEKVLAEPRERPRGRGPGEQPQPPKTPPAPQPPKMAENRTTPQPPQTTNPALTFNKPLDPPATHPDVVPRAVTPGGALGESLHDLRQYVQQQQFNDPGGGGQFGPDIQFDTKGVDFGPWIQRFIAQIRRNWLIPYAVMGMKGHVVLQFNVHKDGSITDLHVAGPSNVDAFNNAAFNALRTSNPTQPLPPEYPSEHAFFTVTFYYNETPPR